MNKTTWRTFPRWLLEDHEVDLQFAAQLSTGRASEVTARIQREPETFSVILTLLANPQTALSIRIGIGVVMEELASSNILGNNLSALGKLAQHSDARIRADACHYLGLSGDKRAQPFLQTCLSDSDAAVRETAQDALASLGVA